MAAAAGSVDFRCILNHKAAKDKIHQFRQRIGSFVRLYRHLHGDYRPGPGRYGMDDHGITAPALVSARLAKIGFELALNWLCFP